MFHLPATAAHLLREHTWMGDVAITNALRNYARDRQDWWILTRRRDHKSYHFVPVTGGWMVFLTSLRAARELANVEPPFGG